MDKDQKQRERTERKLSRAKIKHWEGQGKRKYKVCGRARLPTAGYTFSWVE